jgi:hypothetical protein
MGSPFRWAPGDPEEGNSESTETTIDVIIVTF